MTSGRCILFLFGQKPTNVRYTVQRSDRLFCERKYPPGIRATNRPGPSI